MRGRELEALYRKYLLAGLPGFGYEGSLLFVQPITHLLRGFCFESSAFSRTVFYVWRFIQPLYVPSDDIYFTFGDRLHGRWGTGWNIEDGEEAVMQDVLHSMQHQGLPFLHQVQSPRYLAENTARIAGNPMCPYVVQAKAYSFVMAGDYEQAVHHLDRLAPILDDVVAEADDEPWWTELQHQSSGMRKLLDEDPKQAVCLLEEWSDQTRANLRLPPRSHQPEEQTSANFR